MPGNLTGYDCEECLNRGYTTVADDDGRLYCYECACMPIRRSLRNIEKSGLAGVIDLWTFDAYITYEPRLKRMIDRIFAFDWEKEAADV